MDDVGERFGTSLSGSACQRMSSKLCFKDGTSWRNVRFRSGEGSKPSRSNAPNQCFSTKCKLRTELSQVTEKVFQFLKNNGGGGRRRLRLIHVE
jgi:hypothetical protein